MHYLRNLWNQDIVNPKFNLQGIPVKIWNIYIQIPRGGVDWGNLWAYAHWLLISEKFQELDIV